MLKGIIFVTIKYKYIGDKMKKYYRVKKGDTLLMIAEDFLIPPFKLIADNALSGEVYQGQVLIIDKLERKLYRVKPFDTIKSVCANFCISTEDFISINKTDYIYPGILVYV